MTGDVIPEKYIKEIVDIHEARNLERIRTLEKQVSALEKTTEKRIAELEKLLDARMVAQELAVRKSEEAYNARFTLGNEFRSSINDITARSASREYVEAKIESLRDYVEEKIDSLGRNTETKFNDHGRRLGILESAISTLNGRIIGYTAGAAAMVLIISIVSQLLGLGK